MSEENTVDTESETPEVSPAENFINAVTAKDFVSASKDFEDIMMAKVGDALDQEKINLAGQVFNDEDPSEEEIDDTEESDEVVDNTEEEDSEEEWNEDESNKRMDIIGQNGNDGLHYDQDDNDGVSPE
tara:strand:- start:2467 stop:2850 length:384 start_codon:yes stop_codon:yes gene_type:complete